MESPTPQSIALLGRQPALGLAELEALYGAEKVVPYGSVAALLDLAPEQIAFDRLGSTIRIARILTTLPSNNWRDIERYLLTTLPEKAASISGKLSFGISAYNAQTNAQKLARTALLLKKAIKATGASVRMVPHKNLELGAATVLYNKLTAQNGWEILIVSDGKSTIIAQTVRIQDIDAYAARDQARPHRDAKVGMLPPKLAQTIINLATGPITSNESTGILVLDPFCGTGVVLQEATLMDYDVYGSDIEARMVQYTIDNLTWLDTLYPQAGDYRRVEIGDASKHTWNFSHLNSSQARLIVAGETYLGQPLTTLPSSEHLSKIMYEVNQLHHRFLKNLAQQIPSNTRICLAIPAWRGKREFLHLSVLDYLSDLGYNRVSFKYTSQDNLIYHREGQVVARELLVLTKQ
jgi:tRNA (guanine10-N2)-dimethyltransferase